MMLKGQFIPVLLLCLMMSTSCTSGEKPVLHEKQVQKTFGKSYKQIVKNFGFEGTETNSEQSKDFFYYTWDINGKEFSCLFTGGKARGCITPDKKLKETFLPRIEKKSYEDVVKIIGKAGRRRAIKHYKWQGAENTYADAWFVDDSCIMAVVGQKMDNDDIE